MKSKLVKIGRVRGVHGLFGFLRIEIFNPESPMFEPQQRLLIGNMRDYSEYTIEKKKTTTRQTLIKLVNINNIDSAKRFIGKYVMVPRDALPKIANDEYYMEDLIGMEVFNLRGEKLGEVSGFDTNRVQDLLAIDNNGLRFLLPDIPEFVVEIDIDDRKIIVNPPDGLFDDPSIAEKIR